MRLTYSWGTSEGSSVTKPYLRPRQITRSEDRLCGCDRSGLLNNEIDLMLTSVNVSVERRSVLFKITNKGER
jgi:hypothetical protein